MADARIDTPRYLGRLVRGLRGAVTLRLRPRQRPAPRPAPGPPAAGDLDAAEQAALEQLGAAARMQMPSITCRYWSTSSGLLR